MIAVALAFWISVALILYTHLGYPLVLRALVALRRTPTLRPGTWEEPPRVSLIVAAFDEEEVIAAMIANSFALDYPRPELDLLVTLLGSAARRAAGAVARGVALV